MARAGRVRAGEDLAVQRGLRQLLQRELEHLHVVGGVVGARVAGPQDPGQDLTAAGNQQRVEPEPAFVMPGRVFFVGVHVDRCRVELHDHTTRCAASLPRALASARTGLANAVELTLTNAEQHPARGRDGRHITEQRRLPCQPGQVGNAVPAVGGHHRQITQNPSRIMTAATLTRPRQHHAEPVGQTEPVRHQRQQRGPGTRRQTDAVRPHIYLPKR
jgi:hypothetical protein